MQLGLCINSVKLLCAGADDCFPGLSLILTNNVPPLLLEQYAAQFSFILGITDHITVALMGQTSIWYFSLYRRVFPLPVDLH